MAPRKDELSERMHNPKGKRNGGNGDGDGGNGNGNGNDRDEEGNAVLVHQAYLEHRLQGGEPATPEAYHRAFEQFQRLPGAVRSVPPVIPKPEPGDEPEGKIDDKDKKGEG